MSLEFPVGSTNGMMQCLNITIEEDAVLEGDETFTVTLALVTTGLNVAIDNAMANITITDNEGCCPSFVMAVCIRTLYLCPYSGHSVPPHGGYSG